MDIDIDMDMERDMEMDVDMVHHMDTVMDTVYWEHLVDCAKNTLNTSDQLITYPSSSSLNFLDHDLPAEFGECILNSYCLYLNALPVGPPLADIGLVHLDHPYAVKTDTTLTMESPDNSLGGKHLQHLVFVSFKYTSLICV